MICMKTFKLLLAIASVCIAGMAFYACEDEDKKEEHQVDELVREFGGRYKLSSIHAKDLMDLNNDGNTSNELLSELMTPHIDSNGEAHPLFFNPVLHQAEVRPLAYHTVDMNYIAFNFPYQEISDIAGEPSLIFYKGEFINYSYQMHADNTVDIIDNNPEYSAPYGSIHSLKRIDEKRFAVEMTVKMFDYISKKQEFKDLTVVYSKIADE